MVDDMPSLLSLQEELTCSICLSPFESPVTLPCGHNFCQTCLDESWRDMSYVCPQCRTRFSDKPVLKKNTVLNAVVETFKMKSGEPVAELKLKKAAPQVVVMCDTCMEASASKTCLTCMASFCLDHLRPHQNNPIFKSHQLTDPMLDMHEHMCPEHSKSMEFYCEDHGRCICSSCFHVHKSCSFTGLDEQRQKKEANFRSMLTVVDGKVEKNESVIYQMKEQLSRLNESASNRKSALQAEYQQLRDLIDKDELAALSAVDKAMQGGQDKLASLMKKFSQNVEKLSKAKTEINDLLLQSASLSFLQASVDLPAVVNFEPYCPQINLDSKDVISYHTSAVALKDLINTILLKPVEARISFIKPGNRMPPFQPVFPGEAGSAPYQHSSDPSHLKGPPGPKNKPKGGKKKPNDNSRKQPNQRQGPGSAFSKSTDNLTSLLDFFSPQKGATADPGNVARDISTAIVRSNLLKYGTNLTFDPRTAHKRIILSDNFSKATVSEEPASYPDCPARFSVCSQVLCNKGFSQGCHYWEVKMSSNNFCGLGFAYDSINRKGPASRLGRNTQSYCVEWFNGKLSAWHASSETSIANPNPSRVGILLDCDRGTATFYTVADRAYPFHTFVFPLSEAVFPAFWIFSSGSSASLCKLQA